MNRLNPTGVFLATIVLVLVALFIPGPVGAVLLLVLALAAGALLFGAWQRLPVGARAIRLAAVALLVVIAASRLF
jgi:energy-coupling factor transporter transmembrane protein EcfT